MSNPLDHDPPDVRSGPAPAHKAGPTEQTVQSGFWEGASPGRKVFKMKRTGHVSGLPPPSSVPPTPKGINIFATPRRSRRGDQDKVRRSPRNQSQASSRSSEPIFRVAPTSAHDAPVAPAPQPHSVPKKSSADTGYPVLSGLGRPGKGINIFATRRSRVSTSQVNAWARRHGRAPPHPINIFALGPSRRKNFEPRRSSRAQSSTASKSSALTMETDSDENVNAVRSDVGFVMATATRRYDEWTAPKTGETIKLKLGLVLPVGYEPGQIHPGRPWVCPMRDCRVLARALLGLANHFKAAHKNLSLNDNLDGTFSKVGTHGGSSAIIVSKDPLGPNALPPASPRLPMGVPCEFDADRKFARMPAAAIQTETAPAGEQTPSPNVSSFNQSLLISDPNGLWAHICAVLGQDLPVPASEPHRILLHQPLERVLGFNDPLDHDLNNLTERQALSLLIQVTGIVRGTPCSSCRRDGSPFHLCVSLPKSLAGKLNFELGTQKYSCACCFFHRYPTKCSVKSSHPKPVVASTQKPAAMPKTASASRHSSSVEPTLGTHLEYSDGDDSNDVPLARLRQNLLLSVAAQKRQRGANGQFLPQRTDEAVFQSAEDHDPPAKRRLVATNVSNGATATASGNSSRQTSTQVSIVKGKAKQVAIPSVNRVSAIPAEMDDTSSLGMEDWEINGGQVASGNSLPGVLASHMSLGQGGLQIADNVSLTSSVITSGSTYSFAADPNKIRACVLLAGKVKVDVDGEAQFTVGPQGVFRIAPGVGCSVHNHFYVDATMQITTVTGI